MKTKTGGNRWGSLIVLVMSLVLPGTGPLLAQESVQIVLRSDFSPRGNVALISEVADISGGSPSMRKAIGDLDLSVDRANYSGFSKNEIELRLQLAGFLSSQFKVSGANVGYASRSENIVDATAVQHAIAKHVADALGVEQDDVLVEIKKLPDLAFDPAAGQISLQPLDHADQMIGNRSITLGVFQNGQLLERVQVGANTYYLRDVLVARVPIEKGEQLSPSNSFMKKAKFDRVATTRLIDQTAFGQTTSRRIRGQQMIRSADLQKRRTQYGDAEIVIRSRSLVTAVAVKGSLRVTMSGLEAMRSGKQGDTIPLKNLSTKKVIYGRIIGPNQVEVLF